MDREIIIYIIFLVIALLGRLMGGKKGQKKPAASGGQPSRRPQQPVKSFEELLQEFTSGREPSPEPTFDDEWEEDELVDEREVRRAGRPLQRETENPFTFERQDKLRSLDEMVNIEGVKTKSTVTLQEEEEEEAAMDEPGIREMLKNPEDARKAIILAEILQRKYH
ncbi:hypothetical protein [Fulvivirga sedimenti]|uniref:Uncharacterized protein n=1 Tax=Fulvivirga sedimenti TaxID=2879465 RepID=A0A9X1HQL4_9BACT|nr:hypothetical protein [Fulvivirga sedimenti]MCA6074948.1 hypothetical protein [Fulvivirga sedimenti]MCA6076125.1 hypothetical protein [Fulvivirga sedimenti]MCA6077253.1 hypothetical protein [Fulvivirga sedimenti]